MGNFIVKNKQGDFEVKVESHDGAHGYGPYFTVFAWERNTDGIIDQSTVSMGFIERADMEALAFFLLGTSAEEHKAITDVLYNDGIERAYERGFADGRNLARADLNAADTSGFERGYTFGFEDGQAEERAMNAPIIEDLEPDDLTRDFIDDLQDFDHDFDPYAGQ